MARTKNGTKAEDVATVPAAFDPHAFKPETADFELKTTNGADKYADNPFTAQVRQSYESSTTLKVDALHSQAGEITAWLRDAAKKENLGIALRYRYRTVKEDGSDDFVIVGALKDLPADEMDYPVTIGFIGKTMKQTAERDRVTCPECNTVKTVNADGTIRNHKDSTGNRCAGSGMETAPPEDDNTSEENAHE